MIDLRHCSWEELLPILPPKSVDLLCIDPPYGMDFENNLSIKKCKGIQNDNNLDWLPSLVVELKRIMKDESHMYIFCSWHKVDIFKQELERHFEIKNLLIIAKNCLRMGDLFGGYGGSHELCFFINNGKRDLNGRREPDVFLQKYRTKTNFHPMQKAINLIEHFIEKSSDKGDLVLDCFSGSATTAIACHNTGRNFIGCEIAKEWYDISVKRLNIEMNQGRLF